MKPRFAYAATLNVDRYPLPEGAKPPLEALNR